MTSKEGNELIVDDAQQPEDMDEDSGGSSSSVRVKGVEEINSTVNLSASPSEESGKRKLPVWMQSNSESKDVKRTKTGSGQELKNRTKNDPDSAVASSSSIDGASGNDLQHPQGQQEDENAVQNNEINASNEAASTNEPEDAKNEVIIKEEPEEACSSNTGEADGGHNTEQVEVDESKVKTENEDSSEPASSSAVDSKADIKVVKVEATSSTRDSCKFGVRCYRRNPLHRIEEAHPGDNDYRRPDFPDPPKGTPPCPYGDRCYRRNPSHFQSFSHPPSTNFKKNWQKRQQRQRKQKKDADFEYDDDFIDDDDEDLDDPFSDDASDDEYVPSDD